MYAYRDAEFYRIKANRRCVFLDGREIRVRDGLGVMWDHHHDNNIKIATIQDMIYIKQDDNEVVILKVHAHNTMRAHNTTSTNSTCTIILCRCG